MIRTAAALTCVLLFCSAPHARQLSAPAISAISPPQEAIRKPDLTISVAHGPVTLVTYNANGRFLATVSADHIIRLWEARPGEQGTGALIREFKGHTARILALTPGTTPNTLVSISADQTARTWDESSSQMVQSVPVNISSEVRRLVRVPGNEPIAAVWSNSQLRLWNYETGQFTRTIELEQPQVLTLTFSADSRMLATGTADGTVRLWDLGAGKLVRSFKAHDSAANDVAFDRRAQQVATAGADDTVKVWDVESGALLATLAGHTADVLSVTFSLNGQKLASGSADGTARTWSIPLAP
jgi:WD40 repeat protein